MGSDRNFSTLDEEKMVEHEQRQALSLELRLACYCPVRTLLQQDARLELPGTFWIGFFQGTRMFICLGVRD